MDQESLIDRIYECSAVPGLWPEVLDDIAGRAGGAGGLLFSANQQLHWTASPAVHPVFEEYVRDGWFARCSRRVCLMRSDAPSFFVEQDFWSEEELARDPIYRDFFRPRGLGWSAGTGLRVPTGDNIVFSVERAFDAGPVPDDTVEWLNGLRPHLARSALVSARLHLRQAQGAGEAMAALGLPSLLLSREGVLVEMTVPPGVEGPALVDGPGGQFALADRAASKALGEALAGLRAGRVEAGASFPVRDEGGAAAWVAHLLPIRRSAGDVFGSSFALLYFSPLAAGRPPGNALLRSLFDLTPAEARVAQGLAAGLDVEALATGGGVAVSTVRSQLRQVLQKTGCQRQADVAALVTRIGARDVSSI